MSYQPNPNYDQNFQQPMQQQGFQQPMMEQNFQQPMQQQTFQQPMQQQTFQQPMMQQQQIGNRPELPSEPAVEIKRSFLESISDYLVNDGTKFFIVIFWVVACCVAFGERVRFYLVEMGPIVDILSFGITGARAAAQVVKLNCSLLLITVLRNFLSWLRNTFVGAYLPIDKNIVFHRYAGWTMALFATIHVTSHMFNFNFIANASTEDAMTLGFDGPVAENLLAFTTLPGLTGYIVVVIMVFIFSSALKRVRSPMFNVFWYTHHLFILFFGLLCFHGGAQIFGLVTFWYWILFPALFYTAERTIRVLRGNQATILLLAVAHPSKVIELQMKKAEFKYKPGQYLFLNCPYLAGQEWHPFTITSAPEEEFVSLHIRIVGDWTGDLWEFMNPQKKLGVVQENVLSAPDTSAIFRIDGPFGAASEEVFDFKTVILVGGGIGVTPFGSILKSIRFKIQQGGASVISKVYFFWVSRDRNAFEWFSDILAALEQENLNNFLEINTYLTGNLSLDEIKSIMYGADYSNEDQITGLQSPTHFGRPNWPEIFQQTGQKHSGTDIGVFFCGPAVLSKQLYRNCSKYTDTSSGTRFIYHKENF